MSLSVRLPEVEAGLGVARPPGRGPAAARLPLGDVGLPPRRRRERALAQRRQLGVELGATRLDHERVL
eukprot:scaffold104086_cov54-Phaeocystis_antarctica.AAC.1